jgi:hypothetical protein
MPEEKNIDRSVSEHSRQRLNESYAGQPLISPAYDPLDAVNRAKRGDGIPAAGSDPLTPTGVADSTLGSKNGGNIDQGSEPTTTTPKRKGRIAAPSASTPVAPQLDASREVNAPTEPLPLTGDETDAQKLAKAQGEPVTEGDSASGSEEQDGEQD